MNADHLLEIVHLTDHINCVCNKTAAFTTIYLTR